MENNLLETRDLAELGRELFDARRKAKMTQEDAARIIDVARTTITAIEKGERKIKEGELIKLAHAYGRQANDFLRPRPKVAPFHVQYRGPFRKTVEDVEDVEPAIDELEEICRNQQELEDLTKSPLIRKYPAEYDTTGLAVDRAAEEIAQEERNRLRLGDGPIRMLRDIIEQEVGLRVAYLAMPATFSALYFYDEVLGGCIAVNAKHLEERRRMSLAHDYCHFLTSRTKPEVTADQYYQRLPESERLANAFMQCFLMPTDGLTRRFHDIRRTRGQVTVEDLVRLAHFYGVSFEALILRLEALKLLPTGTTRRVQDGGFKIQEARQQLGLEEVVARTDKFPLRYAYLAFLAFDRALITEGRFARLLDVDRLDAREIAEKMRRTSNTLPLDHDLMRAAGS